MAVFGSAISSLVGCGTSLRDFWRSAFYPIQHIPCICGTDNLAIQVGCVASYIWDKICRYRKRRTLPKTVKRDNSLWDAGFC